MSNFPLLYYLITCFLSCFPPCPSILPVSLPAHTFSIYPPLHFSSTTQIFNSLLIFFDTQLIFSTLYSEHTYSYYYYIIYYLITWLHTKPCRLQLKTTITYSLHHPRLCWGFLIPNFIVLTGASYCCPYPLLSHTFSGFLTVQPALRAPAACPQPYPFLPVPTPSILPLPLPPLSPDLYSFLSFLFAAVPLFHSPIPTPCPYPFSPYYILLLYFNLPAPQSCPTPPALPPVPLPYPYLHT